MFAINIENTTREFYILQSTAANKSDAERQGPRRYARKNDVKATCLALRI